MSTITKADFLAFADDCATAAGACGTTWSADALIAVLDDPPCRHAFTSLLNTAAQGADTTAAQAELAAAVDALEDGWQARFGVDFPRLFTVTGS